MIIDPRYTPIISFRLANQIVVARCSFVSSCASRIDFRMLNLMHNSYLINHLNVYHCYKTRHFPILVHILCHVKANTKFRIQQSFGKEITSVGLKWLDEHLDVDNTLNKLELDHCLCFYFSSDINDFSSTASKVINPTNINNFLNF